MSGDEYTTFEMPLLVEIQLEARGITPSGFRVVHADGTEENIDPVMVRKTTTGATEYTLRGLRPDDSIFWIE